MTIDPVLARKNWRTLEPYHGFIYFSPDAANEYSSLGLPDASGYFASRAAPMGAVTPEVVTATFFNFNPRLVATSMEGVWGIASPEVVHAARMRAVDVGLRRSLVDLVDSAEMTEAVSLARTASDGCTAPGRPLYAGLVSLDWPSEAHLQLWHAISLVREYRGDGHVAALTTEGLGALEALHLHAASGEVPAGVLQSTRGWSDEAWGGAGAGMVERGLLDGAGGLTDEGSDLRRRIEDTTDRLALAPWQHLGEEGSNRLRELVRPFSKAIVEQGGLPQRD